MVNKHMKDDNWQSGRQSILKKYDKNGDGIYDSDEVNAIVDDYMVTMKNNASLIDTNEGQKKIIIFSAIMILLLSISNLGTAYLAVSLAKEVKVLPDGTMTSADGSDKALKTLSKVESLTMSGKTGSSTVSAHYRHGRARRGRRLAEDGVEGEETEEEEEEAYACFTVEEVMAVYKNAQEGSGTSIIIQDEENPGVEVTFFVGGTTEKKLTEAAAERRERMRRLSSDVAENGNGGDLDHDHDDHSDMTDFVWSFPDSRFTFEYAPEKCAQQKRRKLHWYHFHLSDYIDLSDPPIAGGGSLCC